MTPLCKTLLVLCTNRILILSISIATIFSVGYWSLNNSAKEQDATNRTISEQVLRNIYNDIGNIKGVMSSLASMYQVFPNYTTNDMDIYAQNAMENAMSISSIARFDTVNRLEIEDFKLLMSERGIYNFAIHDSQDAHKSPSSILREQLAPIISIVPITPKLAPLFGLDIASSANLEKSISETVASNFASLALPSSDWNNDSHVLMLQPTYRGKYVPNNIRQRLSQLDGGFIFDLDLIKLAANLPLEANHLDIQFGFSKHAMNKHSHSEINWLSEIIATENQQYYLTKLFQGFKHESSTNVGLSSLHINLAAKPGLPLEAIKKSAVNMLLCLLTLTTLFALYRNQRQIQRDHAKAKLALFREREAAHVTLNAIADAVITIDNAGLITYVNPATQTLLKKDYTKLIGNPVHLEVLFKSDPSNRGIPTKPYSMLQALENKTAFKFPELWVVDSQLKATQVNSTLSPLHNDDTDLMSRGAVLVMRDISAEKSLSRELEFQATHDTLTKIANRYMFELKLQKLVDSAKSSQTQHAICYMDLDQFKLVNDTCGHSAGDKLLIQVTRGLQNLVSEHDTLARLGGDEFGLLITNSTDVKAEAVAREIYAFFQSFYYQHGENVFAVRASIGFVHITKQFSSVEDVMAAADLACYSAKDRGRNELHIFSQSCQETNARKGEMMLLPKLQNALRSDNFCLFVQLIEEINTTRVEPVQHYEILLRLVEEDGRLITPFQLILAAERYDLMRDIDRWVISNALDIIANLGEVYGNTLPIFSINLSGQSTSDPDLQSFITEQLSNTGVDPKNLCFEITETSAIANLQQAVQLVEFLHSVGAKLALDDFGSGVSSFGYLKTLKVDYLKIDGQFIKHIASNEVDKEMVRCMQAIAKLLNIKTIAEFVENEEIAQELTSLGLNFGQGYHYCIPHPIEQLFDQNAKARKSAA